MKKKEELPNTTGKIYEDVSRKKKLMVPRDLTLESYKNPEDIHIVWKHRIKAEVIDAPSYIRGIPKKLPPYDPFLAYLEFKMSKPWYERLFLP